MLSFVLCFLFLSPGEGREAEVGLVVLCGGAELGREGDAVQSGDALQDGLELVLGRAEAEGGAIKGERVLVDGRDAVRDVQVRGIAPDVDHLAELDLEGLRAAEYGVGHGDCHRHDRRGRGSDGDTGEDLLLCRGGHSMGERGLHRVRLQLEEDVDVVHLLGVLGRRRDRGEGDGVVVADALHAGLALATRKDGGVEVVVILGIMPLTESGVCAAVHDLAHLLLLLRRILRRLINAPEDSLT